MSENALELIEQELAMRESLAAADDGTLNDQQRVAMLQTLCDRLLVAALENPAAALKSASALTKLTDMVATAGKQLVPVMQASDGQIERIVARLLKQY